MLAMIRTDEEAIRGSDVQIFTIEGFSIRNLPPGPAAYIVVFYLKTSFFTRFW
jgi:hypothetical protein